MLARLKVRDAILLTVLALSVGAAAGEQPAFVVRRPTIVAFFPPAKQAELATDADTNEALADFQVYATRVREPLRKLGVDFHEVYAKSFKVRIGTTTTTFRPRKITVGYYFVALGKKPRVEYGVITDSDILEIAKQYFGTAGK